MMRLFTRKLRKFPNTDLGLKKHVLYIAFLIFRAGKGLF
jgi:hypothetical protein